MLMMMVMAMIILPGVDCVGDDDVERVRMGEGGGAQSQLSFKNSTICQLSVRCLPFFQF